MSRVCCPHTPWSKGFAHSGKECTAAGGPEDLLLGWGDLRQLAKHLRDRCASLVVRKQHVCHGSLVTGWAIMLRLQSWQRSSEVTCSSVGEAVKQEAEQYMRRKQDGPGCEETWAFLAAVMMDQGIAR
jgi:hypothetical protein